MTKDVAQIFDRNEIAQVFVPEDASKKQIEYIRKKLKERGVKSIIHEDPDISYNPKIIYQSRTYRMETIHLIPDKKRT